MGSLQERRGVLHFQVAGKGSKTYFVPAYPAAAEAIDTYPRQAGHGEDLKGPLFRPTRNNRTSALDGALTGDGIYKMLKDYAKAAEVQVEGLCLHATRATAATHALEHDPDIEFTQE